MYEKCLSITIRFSIFLSSLLVVHPLTRFLSSFLKSRSTKIESTHCFLPCVGSQGRNRCIAEAYSRARSSKSSAFRIIGPSRKSWKSNRIDSRDSRSWTSGGGCRPWSGSSLGSLVKATLAQFTNTSHGCHEMSKKQTVR